MRVWLGFMLFIAACGADSENTESNNNVTNSSSALTGVKSVQGGLSTSCAIMNDGELVCWGGDLYGTLGRGPTEEGLAGQPKYAAPVVGGLSFKEVALVQTACGVTTDGALYCWGPNDEGQLGVEGVETELISLGGFFDKPASKTPVEVFPAGVTHVGVGMSHVCASFENGDVKCWGQAKYGAGGVIDEIENGAAPADIEFDGATVAQIELGVDASCLRNDAGEIYCWGSNFIGLLGVPDDRDNPDHLDCAGGGQLAIRYCTTKPQLVPLPGPAKKLDVTNACACAALENGEMYCWGSPVCGFGVESNEVKIAPTKFDVPANVDDFAVTGEAVCVIAGGKVSCAGYGYHGLTGSFEDSPTLVEIDGYKSTPVSLAGGQDFVCATLEDSTVACLGANDSWQAGVRAPVDAQPGKLKTFSLTSPVTVEVQP
ncbi:MAG: hypothetical protein R3E66_01385 [bacterium]